jgi:hypothetical protein
MKDIIFRCSSVGRLMTEPRSKSEGHLSKGARTYIRKLVAEELFGVDFEISGKELEKGTRCEPDSIALLNRVLGLSLTKNAERRVDDYLSGECDLFHAEARAGYDLKTSWSLATFPIAVEDCEDSIYEWQARAYLRLWDADRWTVAYAMVTTPDDLVRYEPQSLHFVDHIPESMRLTTWTIERDAEKEHAMVEKIKHARGYFRQVAEEFGRTHSLGEPLPAVSAFFQDTAGAVPATEPGHRVALVKNLNGPEAGHLSADLLDHIGRAFRNRFPSQPKVSQEWWADLKTKADALRAATQPITEPA